MRYTSKRETTIPTPFYPTEWQEGSLYDGPPGNEKCQMDNTNDEGNALSLPSLLFHF
jgi:hypothetical protein